MNGGVVVELFAQIESELSSGLEMVQWAEEEITAAQQRWPEYADVLFHSFNVIAPTGLAGLQREPVYRSYARELLDRIGCGDSDTRRGTAVEVCLALREVSLRAPMTHEGFALYLRMWKAAGLPEVTDVGEHYEAISGDRLDDLETEARQLCSNVGRMLETPSCEGQHHGTHPFLAATQQCERGERECYVHTVGTMTNESTTSRRICPTDGCSNALRGNEQLCWYCQGHGGQEYTMRKRKENDGPDFG